MNSSNSFFVFSVFISIIIYLKFLHLKYRTGFKNFKIILIFMLNF
nr:MAG TPA: hypothetical protein [Bacteriophage sp.]